MMMLKTHNSHAIMTVVILKLSNGNANANGARSGVASPSRVRQRSSPRRRVVVCSQALSWIHGACHAHGSWVEAQPSASPWHIIAVPCSGDKIGSGCASVLKTHWSSGRTLSSLNRRNRYLRVSAVRQGSRRRPSGSTASSVQRWNEG